MSDQELQDEGLIETALDEGGEIGGMPGDYENEPQDEPAVMETITHERSESGGAWLDLWGVKDGEDFKVHLWQNDPDCSVALFKLLSTLEQAKEWKLLTHPHSLGKTAQPTTTVINKPAGPVSNFQNTTITAPVAPAGNSAPLPPTQAAPVQQQPAGAGGGTFQIAKITVTPQPEGKVLVEFFCAGHQWSDLKGRGTPEQMVTKFPVGWTPEHFSVARTYDNWPCIAYWTPSKNVDKNGHPYKNLVKVEAA